ncbi:hypothetical protein GCM10023082_01340 [Streptomyces tremellae]|uniref:Uncharacterized protein n=1 Tax=Streptomyces tremellae TaxID=1124239 RepID=A0ABP7DKV9_9ACTN
MPELPEQTALRARVDRELARFVGAETDALVAVNKSLAPLRGVLRAATGYGKRLRSAFCYWGRRDSRTATRWYAPRHA